MRRSLLATSLLLAPLAAAGAQQPPLTLGASLVIGGGRPQGPQASSRLCWRPRPLDRCRSYPITEFKAMYGVAPDPRFGVESDLGWMFNVASRSAVGVASFVALDEGGLRIGGMVRYRRWLHGASNVEIGLGSVLLGDELNAAVKPVSPSVTLDWNPSPFLGLFGRVDAVRSVRPVGCYSGPDYYRGFFCSEPTRTDAAWYGGAKVGAQPGAAASVLAAMVVSVLAYIALAAAD